MNPRSLLCQRLLRGLIAALILAVADAGDVRAQSATGMIGKAIGADEQVKNAAGAAEEAIKTVATQGESTRGATGAIGQLITESDTLICSAWIVSFRIRYRDMWMEANADGELDTQEAEALRAMERLMTVVEKACDKVLNPEAYANVAAGEQTDLANQNGVPQVACPECEDLRKAYEQRSYEYSRAQLELSQAMGRTDFVNRTHGRTLTPEQRAAGEAPGEAETPEEAERHEDRKRAQAYNAKQAMERAKQLWLDCVQRCHDAYRRQYGLRDLGTSTGALAGGALASTTYGGLPATGAVGGMFTGAMMVSYDRTETCTFGGGKVAVPSPATDGGPTTGLPSGPKTTTGPKPTPVKPGGPSVAKPDKVAPGVSKPPTSKPPTAAPPPGKPGGPSASAPTKPGTTTSKDDDKSTATAPPKPGLEPPSQPKTALPGNLIIKATAGATAGKAGQAVAGAVVKLIRPDPEFGKAKDAMTAHNSGPVQGTTRPDGTVELRADYVDPSEISTNSVGADEIEVDLSPQAGLIAHHGPGGLKGALPDVKLGRTWTTGGKTQTAVFAAKENIKTVAAALSKMDGVTRVETNACRVKEPSGRDPYYASKGSWKQPHDDQWAIKRVGFGPDPGSPWTATGASKPVVVAVIDTGLDWDHLDIDRANLWTNEKEVPGNGKDDDRNGYVDDVIGWDFMEDDNRPWDRDGHGTFVAGVIAAAHNDVGISGIDPQARIMVLRALNDFGHTRASYLAEAITYAADNGARVVNLSVGGKEPTEAERMAVEYARGKGVLIVAAAGNDAEDVGGYGPAGLPGVLTIAATDFEDRRAPFSNWGKRIDLAAPGLDVLSLRARATDLMRDIPGVEYTPGAAYVGADRRYYRASGTSFAAPIVSGAASLLWSRRPELTVEEVTRVLVHSAKDVDVPGRDQYTGYGLLDVRAALARDPRFFVEAEISGVRVASAGGQTVVEVSGTADADRFRTARLEVGAGSSPQTWKPVGVAVTQPVRSGVLGAIPAQALAGAKEWTIRVITEHADGTRREARFNLKLE